ncbi:unnamed protein product [Prorocentrum cordatum]|uniref:Uncharacterized protein n=1 Tax=Prorocentrum cordatum TaxID=2364126 RepID=A0ABN9S2T7_9DINO|nr:unnamed protein product [Polarella glacialis]
MRRRRRRGSRRRRRKRRRRRRLRRRRRRRRRRRKRSRRRRRRGPAVDKIRTSHVWERVASICGASPWDPIRIFGAPSPRSSGEEEEEDESEEEKEDEEEEEEEEKEDRSEEEEEEEGGGGRRRRRTRRRVRSEEGGGGGGLRRREGGGGGGGGGEGRKIDPQHRREELDTDALVKYLGAVVLQLSLVAAFFAALDLALGPAAVASVPDWAAFLLFYGMALRSRIFSPLDNSRPDAAKAAQGETSRGFNDRVMPSWTPPGVFFPIMWVLIIGPLRAASSVLVWQQVGHLCDATILALMLHLCVGDTWNTINNVERRLGAAVPGVFCTWLSAVFAAYSYYQVVPLAGQLSSQCVCGSPWPAPSSRTPGD